MVKLVSNNAKVCWIDQHFTLEVHYMNRQCHGTWPYLYCKTNLIYDDH